MASYYQEHTILFLNGEYLKASEAKIDLYSQSLHYGYAVFEGLRAYRSVNGETRIFKAGEHFARLKQSAAALNLPYPYSAEELTGICYELLEKNHLANAYIRPLVFAPANMSFTLNTESFLTIETWEMDRFLGDRLLKVMTSPFERPHPKAFNMEAKAAGLYVNSIVASQHARAKGYDEALLNDIHGFVAEAPGANMFYEKEGKLITPPKGHILPGITRATIIEICASLEIAVEERLFTTDEVKQQADAAFFCGTATEVIGWESLDGTRMKKNWDQTVSRVIQDAYQARVTAKQFVVAVA